MARFFLTGATGALGSYLLKEILQSGNDLDLLVRAQKGLSPSKKIGSLLDFFKLDRDLLRQKRIRVFWGDISSPQLGLSQSDLYDILESSDYMIHSAADLSFDTPLEVAFKACFDPIRFVLQVLSDSSTSRPFKKVTLVSTVGVGGRSTPLVPEGFLSKEGDFHNNYERAKRALEDVVQQALECDTPLAVARPSMIIGDSHCGQIYRFQIFYHIAQFLAGLKTLGILPELGERTLDVINVDYVARGIQSLTEDPQAVGKVFHLCSGPKKAPSLQQVQELSRQAHLRHNLPLPTLRYLPRNRLQSLLNGLQFARHLPLPHNVIGRIKAMNIMLEYLGTEQEFENQLTLRYLSERGLRPSDPLDYIPKSLDYYLNKKVKSHRPRGLHIENR